jgi:hypothetical protein
LAFQLPAIVRANLFHGYSLCQDSISFRFHIV